MNHPIPKGKEWLDERLCCLAEAINDPTNVVGIENGILSQCYQDTSGNRVDVEVRRDDDGALLGYTIHSTTGTTDVADLTSLEVCPPDIGTESAMLNRCYQNAAGEKVDVEVVRDELGVFVGYTIHAPGGQTDVTDLSSLTACDESCPPLNNSGLVTNVADFN